MKENIKGILFLLALIVTVGVVIYFDGGQQDEPAGFAAHKNWKCYTIPLAAGC